MRYILSIFVMFAILATAPLSAGAQPTECAVSDVYAEAFNEHNDALLALSVRVNTGGGVLNDTDTAAVTYKLMMSMREYHEDRRATLPDCAQALNTALLDAVTSGQDVLTMILLTQLTFGDTYTDDLAIAVADLRDAFGTLDAAQGQTRFVTP